MNLKPLFSQNTNKKEGPEPNTTGPADGQSEYSRSDETAGHKHFHQTAPIPIPRAVKNWMGELQSQVRFKTVKKEGPEPNTTGPADGQSEYSRSDETADHKHQ